LRLLFKTLSALFSWTFVIGGMNSGQMSSQTGEAEELWRSTNVAVMFWRRLFFLRLWTRTRRGDGRIGPRIVGFFTIFWLFFFGVMRFYVVTEVFLIFKDLKFGFLWTLN